MRFNLHNESYVAPAVEELRKSGSKQPPDEGPVMGRWYVRSARRRKYSTASVFQRAQTGGAIIRDDPKHGSSFPARAGKFQPGCKRSALSCGRM